jgi:hypothetical protein
MVHALGVMAQANYTIPTLLETQQQIEDTINTMVTAQLNSLSGQVSAMVTKLNNLRPALDGLADINNWPPAQKTQLHTMLDSLGIT